MEIEEDNLFIDIDTLFMNSENIEKCDNFQIGAQQGIEAQIKKAFTFQIISVLLEFETSFYGISAVFFSINAFLMSLMVFMYFGS